MKVKPANSFTPGPVAVQSPSIAVHRVIFSHAKTIDELSARTKRRGVLLPLTLTDEVVEQFHWRRHVRKHVGAISGIEWLEDHSESNKFLVARYRGDAVLGQSVPLLLCHGHCGQRNDFALFVIQMRHQ